MSEGRAEPRRHTVRVGPLPAWVSHDRLLGPGPWTAAEAGWFEASLPRPEATDVAARLRGLGLDGEAVQVMLRPKAPRTAVREARTRDARARRDSSIGFSRKGARTDDEGRWSLTPERLALQMARRALKRLHSTDAAPTVLDLGCGVGGNSIGFARAGANVLAIERDTLRSAMARHNARVYGVQDRMRTQAADVLSLLHAPPPADLWFVDPPWGTDWNRTATPLASVPLLAEVRSAACAAHVPLLAKLPPSAVAKEAPDAYANAWFGHAKGDAHRIKFVTLFWPRPANVTVRAARLQLR